MADVDLSSDDLIRIKQEIKMSEKYLEQELTPIIQENLERYTGHFIPGMAQDWDIVLNEFYPIIQYNLPSIFFRNPRVFLKPRQKTYIAKKRNPLSGVMEEVQLDSGESAKTQEALLNYILQEIKYKKEVRRVLFDALTMPYSVLWHGYKGDFGMTEEQSLFIKKESLWVKRISPLRFHHDPAVTIANLDEARWIGRSFDIPIVDILEDETLDVDKKEIKGHLGFGEKVGTKDALANLAMAQNGIDYLKVFQSGSRALIEYTSDAYRKSKSVRFVTVYEIFQRPTKKEAREGEKGKVILITDEQNKPLRVSKWPYKMEGWPAEILQFNEVQDSHLGLDDFRTYSSIADQKNIIVNEQVRNAKQLNKVWVAIAKEGMSAEEDQQKIRDGRNTVVFFDADQVSGKMVVASAAGGASSELYLLDQRIDRQLQDKSGVTDLKKGFLQSGEESAASVQLRAAGGSARPAYRQDIMADFLRESCHKLNQLNKQYMTIDQAVRIIGSLDVQWSNNPTKEEIQADTDVELDVISMLPENPEQELKELNTALSMAINAIEDPTGKFTTKLAQEGYTFEVAPLIEQILLRLKIRNPSVFRRIKPEESQGFAPVGDLRAAGDNIKAALAGSPQIPNPPAPGQNHAARLEMYNEIVPILGELAQSGHIDPNSPALQLLTQLVQLTQALLDEEMSKEASPGQTMGKKMFGAKPQQAIL
jgi:hypothetical protein